MGCGRGPYLFAHFHTTIDMEIERATEVRDVFPSLAGDPRFLIDSSDLPLWNPSVDQRRPPNAARDHRMRLSDDHKLARSLASIDLIHLLGYAEELRLPMSARLLLLLLFVPLSDNFAVKVAVILLYS